MRYVLLVAYDGTHFCGWQVQNNGRTVQAELEGALSRLVGKVRVTASGRTDAGVHAAGQVCHFDAESTIPPERLADGVNPYLPPDVKVLKSAAAREGFDANRTAKRKTYVYRLYFARRDDPLKERYAVRVGETLDFSRMEEAASMLEGEHDFKAFCASGSSVRTTVRTIYRIGFRRAELFEVRVTGNGFLYNMVRTIAGELVAVGAGRLTLSDLKYALETGDRSKVGKTMPAKGLTLESVDYGFQIFSE